MILGKQVVQTAKAQQPKTLMIYQPLSKWQVYGDPHAQTKPHQ
jgi:hypothetical protein